MIFKTSYNEHLSCKLERVKILGLNFAKERYKHFVAENPS